MSKSRNIFLFLFLIFLCSAAVIEVSTPPAPEKTNATAPTTPANTTNSTTATTKMPFVILAPVVPDYTNLFSIGSGFKLPYLETLANFYYPRPVYYSTTPVTYWVAKNKTSTNETKKNETSASNSSVIAEKSDKGEKSAGSQKQSVKQQGNKLLDLGKNITDHNNTQTKIQAPQKSPVSSKNEPAKTLTEKDGAATAEKKLQSSSANTVEVKSVDVKAEVKGSEVVVQHGQKNDGAVKTEMAKSQKMASSAETVQVQKASDSSKVDSSAASVEVAKTVKIENQQGSGEGQKTVEKVVEKPVVETSDVKIQKPSQPIAQQVKIEASPIQTNLKTEAPPAPPAPSSSEPEKQPK